METLKDICKRCKHAKFTTDGKLQLPCLKFVAYWRDDSLKPVCFELKDKKEKEK